MQTVHPGLQGASVGILETLRLVGAIATADGFSSLVGVWEARVSVMPFGVLGTELSVLPFGILVTEYSNFSSVDCSVNVAAPDLSFPDSGTCLDG